MDENSPKKSNPVLQRKINSTQLFLEITESFIHVIFFYVSVSVGTNQQGAESFKSKKKKEN